MYILGYNRTLALLFHLGVAQTLGHDRALGLGETMSLGLSPPK